MDLLSIFFMAVGLSMDAFAVSLTRGIYCKRNLLRQAMTAAFFFGIFQGIMPMLGWLLGIGFRDKIEAFDHWIAFALLAFIGGKMIYGALKKNKGEDENEKAEETSSGGMSIRTLLLLSVATSIDALAVGVSFAFVGSGQLLGIFLACGIIAATTFIISAGGFFAGKKFGSLFQKHAEVFGGVILIIIGVKILIEHLWSLLFQ